MPDKGLEGGLAAFMLADPTDDPASASLSSPNLTSEVSTFPDGSGLLEWRSGTAPYALLSSKRIPDEVLASLAEEISEGSAFPAGFAEVRSGTGGASVYGQSCFQDGEFVGVEVVHGSLAERIAYVIDTDPTSVVTEGDTTTLTFEPHGRAPLELEAVSLGVWDRLLTQSVQASDTYIPKDFMEQEDER